MPEILEETLEAEEVSVEEYDLTLFEADDYRRTRMFLDLFRRLMSYYRCAMFEIETKFNVLNEAFSQSLDRNPINNIKCRLKSPESIQGKLEKLGCPLTLESIEANLDDIAGVRVTCPFIDDVYLVAEALLKQDDVTLIYAKDYIKNPKPNGYRSLHLIVIVPIFLPKEKQYVKVEIQLRTIAMDFWAALEHQLKYKKTYAFTEDMQKELYECAEISASLDERMNVLRNNVLSADPLEDIGI